MPYRVDIGDCGHDAFDRLVALGAIDIEFADAGRVAALMPDGVPPLQIASALGVHDLSVSPARGRDADSVWILSPRTIRIGRLHIAPADTAGDSDTLRMLDAAAFGTGLHPTTALCLEAIEEAVHSGHPASLLDVGTGSGVLALAALRMGVPRAVGVDLDEEALRVAAENARLNELDERVQWIRGGPDALAATWPLIVANVLAAPLIEMAPSLVRRVGPRGALVLSGIAASMEQQVDQTYRRLGMRHVRVASRAGWIVLVLQASW